MKIYEMTLAELKQLMKDFGKTAYGKTVFLLAYVTSMVLLLAFIAVLTVYACIGFENAPAPFGIYIFGLLLGTFVSFILGNVYYYKELYKFSASRKG